MLQKVRDEGCPDRLQRKDLTDAQTHIMLNRKTPYGALQRSVYVHGCRVEVISPQAMLWQAVQEDGAYSRMLRDALDSNQPTRERPFRLALYADEVTPGNVVSPDNLRKCWCAYWAILDLFPQALHDENAWFLIAVKRSSEVNKVDGKFSAIFGCLIEQFFTGGAHDCSSVGFTVDFADGQSRRVFLKLEQIVQDDAAHKTVWDCMGASGANFCMLCLNAWACNRQKKKAELQIDSGSSSSGGETDDEGAGDAARASDEACPDSVADDADNFVCETTTKVAHLDLATDADIREKLDILDAYHADPKMTTTKFKQHQTALGMNRAPFGIWRNPRIFRHVRPCEQWVPDWMHVMGVGGVINKMLFVILSMFVKFGIQWDVFQGYLSEWNYPRSISSGQNPSSIFKSKRVTSDKKARTVKCQASEAIMVLPVLALFVQLSILPAATGVLRGACLTLLALANVLDLLTLTPRGCVDPCELQDAIERFLALCKDHFPLVMVKKFHSLLHLPHRLQELGMLLTCWVHERKHRMIRRFCNDIQNTAHFERSVMGAVVCQHLFELSSKKNFNYSVGLVDPRAAGTTLQTIVSDDLCAGRATDVQTALKVRVNAWAVVVNGDVVLVKSGRSFTAAYVWKNVAVEGRCVSLVQLARYTEWNSDAGVATWELYAEPTWILSEDILDPCVFCWLGPTTFKTLLGSLYR